MKDTTPEIHEILIQRYRAMSAEDKLKKASNMFATANKFDEIAVKRKDKSKTGIELKIEVFR